MKLNTWKKQDFLIKNKMKVKYKTKIKRKLRLGEFSWVDSNEWGIHSKFIQVIRLFNTLPNT